MVVSKYSVITVFFLLFVSVILLVPEVKAEIIDSDQDGLSDEDETSLYFTDPNRSDTDQDGFDDGLEIKFQYSPQVKLKKMYEVDTDKDGLNDWLEVSFKTNLTVVDTDADGMGDYEEVMRGKSPTDSDVNATTTRRLEVDLTTQRLKYIVDEKLILTMPVSTGMPVTPTPTGDFKILYKVPIMRYRGPDYNLPNVKWNMAFKGGGYFIHTAYWHNNFGKKTNSHGCVNMREKDVALLYKYADVGMDVKVVGKLPKNGIVVVKK